MSDAMLFKLEGAHGFGNPKMAGMGYVHIPVSGKGEITFSEESNTPKKKLGVFCTDLTGLEVEDRGSVSTYVAGQKSGGVGNTAAGAVVGFLLAGPVGTALGAMAGSNSGGTAGYRQGSYQRGVIGLTFSGQRGLIVSVPPRRFDEKLSDLRRLIMSLPEPKPEKVEVDLKTLEKECPACAEDVKLKAKVCRFCGYEWSEADVEKAVNEALNAS